MSAFFVFAFVGLFFFLSVVQFVPYNRRDEPQKTPPSPFERAYYFKSAFSGGTRETNERDAARELARFRILVLGLSVCAFLVLFYVLSNRLYFKLSAEIAESFIEFLGDRRIGSAAFGFGFGIFSGYWFSLILHRQPTAEKPSFTEIALGIVMAVLLVLGILGERALGHLLTHLTTVEVAGAKIGFSSPADKSEDVTQQDARGTPTERTPDAPGGLALLVHLKELSSRDQKFLELAREDPARPPRVDGNLPSAVTPEIGVGIGDVFEPLASCLSDYYESSNDDGRIAEIISPLSAALRAFAYSDGDVAYEKPKKWEAEFWSVVDKLPDELPAGVLAGSNCRLVQGMTGRKNEIDRVMKALRTKEWRESPYLSIMISGLLAYQRQYPAAILNIERWIKGHDTSGAGQDQVLSQIYIVRERGAIIPLMEEWLHGLDVTRRNHTLQRYQLANLTGEIAAVETNADLERIVSKTNAAIQRPGDSSIEKEMFDIMPNDHGTCASLYKSGPTHNDGLDKNALYLARSLLGAKLNWITVAADDADTFREHSATAWRYMKDIAGISLSCMLSDSLDENLAVITKRADILEAYAKIVFNDVKSKRKSNDSEEVMAPLKKAFAALSLAENLLDTYKVPDPDPFSLKVHPVQQQKDEIQSLERQIRAAFTRDLP